MTAAAPPPVAEPVSEHLPRSADYVVARVPNLMTITPGAEIRYACAHRDGAPPQAVGGSSPYRDGINWYKFREAALVERTRAGDPQWGRPVERGPVGQFHWRCAWREPPGRYVVAAEVRRGHQRSFSFLPQYVESPGLVLDGALAELARPEALLPGPEEGERQVARFIDNLGVIAGRFPITDAGRRQAHDEAVDRWRKYRDKLRALLAPTDGRRRIPLRAVHLEVATQAQRPVLLFLADVGGARGDGGVRMERWVLVDWTDPTDSRFHGTYEGEGPTATSAIERALADWRWGNRYPVGELTCDLPAEAGGQARRHRMPTDGTTLGDEVRGVLEWIAVGTMLVAGAALLFTPVPALASGALATSLLSSTGAAVISLGQRHRAGIFDWRADAFDGLTIIGSLFGGANIWRRGARIRGLFPDGADRVFYGAQIGADLVQGVLVAEGALSDFEALTRDSDLTPEERSRKLLELLRSATLAGLISYVSLRASARDLQNLDRKARHFADDDRARSIREKLSDLTTSSRPLDPNRPPVTEGHTDRPRQATTVTSGAARHRGRISAQKTEFARAYPPDRKVWRAHTITNEVIELRDRDGFVFEAKCDGGDLSITVVTSVAPSSPPELLQWFRNVTEQRFSKVLRAKELFPKMYAHFEAVGNPVRRLVGSWAWDNYAVSRAKYDSLMRSGISSREAAKIAVLEATTFQKYHRPQGFGKVTRVKHLPEYKLFEFIIERGE